MAKKLVAYFSAGGTTKKIAEQIAEAGNADLCEITPKVAYTTADLNWMDKKSRSSVEMNDKKFRPEIVKADIDMSAYDTVILGFPIWWYVAPTIVNTFLESYDFTGKKIVLFDIRRQRIRQHSKRIKTVRTWCRDRGRKAFKQSFQTGDR